jgi:putative endonuclease
VKDLGDYFEQSAEDFLVANGMAVIGRNYRCRAGEIDLIARHDQYLVFVEVRARSNKRYASAAASVDKRKQQRLVRSAQHFLQRNQQLSNFPCRFDVITFEPRQSPAEQSPRWIRGAFST